MNETEVKNKDNEGGFMGFVAEVVKFVVLAVIIVVPIRVYVAQPYIVSGSSMYPTFKNGDYLVVDQLTYHFTEPQHVDVFVFRFPNNPSQFFIKRIIGLPGETVRIENGKLVIENSQHPEGVILNEVPYLPSGIRTGGQERLALGQDEYFML